jgi:hypothetical protein
MEVRRLEETVGRNLAKSNARHESGHPIYDVREYQKKDRRVSGRCSAVSLGFLLHRRDSENDSHIVNVSSAVNTNEVEGTDHTFSSNCCNCLSERYY